MRRKGGRGGGFGCDVYVAGLSAFEVLSNEASVLLRGGGV